MSSAKKSALRNEEAMANKVSVTYTLQCKFCKRAASQCTCLGTNKIETQVSTEIKCCEVENCGGVCKTVKQTSSHYSAAIRSVECPACRSVTPNKKCGICKPSRALADNPVKGKTSNAAISKATNGILRTKPTIFACLQCNYVKCDGGCKILTSPGDGVKIQRVSFQDSCTKAVLKCFQCKSPGCNGKCMTSHSRCSTASPNARKSARCVLCKIPSCHGACKIPVLKCNLCFSENCEGTCYLTGRSTNNSLSTVNDFSVLNAFVFTDKHTKCGACSKSCCGKCKNATGFKYCPYCNTDAYNGNNISHSVKSILGTSTKSKADVTIGTQKRAKASTASRRTRSSSTLSKQFASAASNDVNSFSVDDVKRRKKSLPKPVAR